MGARNQEQTRGRIGPQLRLGNLRVGELHFCPLCTALDQASSLSRKLAYVPGPTFGFVKLLASSGSHCTKWADEQHRQAGFESRLLPDLPLPFIPTLIGLRAFDLVSSRVWWEAATNIGLRWGLTEVVGMVQQVHCSRRRLPRRGLEFHVCTINKSAHTKLI